MIEGIPLAVFVPILIWSMVWKGIALWKAGRNNQRGWFIAIFIDQPKYYSRKAVDEECPLASVGW